MWKKDDPKAPGVPENSSASGSGTPAVSSGAATNALPLSPKAAACISQGIRIKGEITGSEDLFVDGPVEGKLNLANGSVTIGPNGSVKADITAREVIVRGRVEGRVTGRDRVQLWNTGHVMGEVQTQRLAIEDGAVLRGKVETGKPVDQSNTERSAEASVASKASSTEVSVKTAR